MYQKIFFPAFFNAWFISCLEVSLTAKPSEIEILIFSLSDILLEKSFFFSRIFPFFLILLHISAHCSLVVLASRIQKTLLFQRAIISSLRQLFFKIFAVSIIMRFFNDFIAKIFA